MSVRAAERLSAAVVRAVGHQPNAELRGTRLEVDEIPMGIVVPYLSLEFDEVDERRRGVADALGLRLRHSDRSLHLELSPTAPIERIVFDVCEQFRCEALVDPSLAGVQANISRAFDRWSDHALGNGIGDTGTGLVIFTITHMLRARLLRTLAKENVDDLIESTRANLGRLAGHALREMPKHIASQRDFAVPAAELARLIGELLSDTSVTDPDEPSSEAVERNRLLIPTGWADLENELAFADVEGAAVAPPSDYHIFTTIHDVETTGSALYRAPVLSRLRRDLDLAVGAQAVSATRLAQRLGPLFHRHTESGFHGGHDHGRIDRARLAQIVADPLNPFVHEQPVQRLTTDAAVTFLVDTTGSMKVQRFEAVAVWCDTLVRALEQLDVTTEVLGFSTVTWAGGESRKEWTAAGSPEPPGRLADTLHVVYKGAEQTWRQSRHSLAAMMRTDHYREGVDGEAIEWAAARLRRRPEQQRVLVVISDGEPMEATTATHNRDSFLFDHLRHVVSSIEHRGDLIVGGIAIDGSVEESFARATTADLEGTLTLSSYAALHRLL